MRRELAVLALVTFAAGIGAAPAQGEVVCRKKSGALAVREACKKKETAFDLAVLDPAPTARAYGCSDAVSDTTVTACPDRPSKGIVSVTANSGVPGYTCFELDPSIDADTATVVASLNTHSSYGGGTINALIGADAYSNYSGCPPNSVVVVTARHTNATTELGLDPAILGINIVVP